MNGQQTITTMANERVSRV